MRESGGSGGALASELQKGVGMRYCSARARSRLDAQAAGARMKAPAKRKRSAGDPCVCGTPPLQRALCLLGCAGGSLKRLLGLLQLQGGGLRWSTRKHADSIGNSRWIADVRSTHLQPIATTGRTPMAVHAPARAQKRPPCITTCGLTCGCPAPIPLLSAPHTCSPFCSLSSALEVSMRARSLRLRCCDSHSSLGVHMRGGRGRGHGAWPSSARGL